MPVFAEIRVLRIRNNADDLVSPRGILRLGTHVDLNAKGRRLADIFPNKSLIDDQNQALSGWWDS
jgi:hypothetical protein